MSFNQQSGERLFLNICRKNTPVWVGILNITPDSFSDGGLYLCPQKALAKALELVKHGAKIIDVGAASSRPGSLPLTFKEELHRLLPVFYLLNKALPSHILLSVDTYLPEVVEELADKKLIHIINDIYAGQQKTVEPESATDTLQLAARYKLGIILMHMQGTPLNMQLNPHYTSSCIDEIIVFLKERLSVAQSLGVKTIALDPGIGFGKNLDHNLELLSCQGLKKLQELNCPIMIGLSRKRFLGEIYNIQEPCKRDIVTKQWEYSCISQGVTLVRSHRMPQEF